MTYTPKPGSAADRAISYLGRVKGEVSTSDLADAIACTPYGLGNTLGRAVDAGLLIKRQHRAGTSAPLFWSLPAESVAEAVAPKPEPATDIPVVQRTVPAAEAGPSGWTPHPLDAAWHPRAANGKDSTARDAGPCTGGEAAQAPHHDCAGPVVAATPTNGRPPARNGHEPEGANRAGSAEQSHGAEGSDSPAGRGTTGAPAVSAAPVSESAHSLSTVGGGRLCSMGENGSNPLLTPASLHNGREQTKPVSGLPEHSAPELGISQTCPPITPASPGGGPVGVEQPAAAGPLVGRTATISMTGEIAVVSECGAVVLFDAQRAQQLLAFFAGRVG